MNSATSSDRLRSIMGLLRELSQDPDPIRSINRYYLGMRPLFGDQALISVSLRGVPQGHYRVMRFLHQPGVGQEGFYDLLFGGREAPVVSGGVLGDFIDSGEPAICRGLTIAWDPVLKDHLSPYRLLAAAPVFDNGEALNWVFFLHTDVEAFSDMDMEIRMLQANLMGGINSAKQAAAELRQATAWIHREVDEIAQLQKGLLPEQLPRAPWYELAACYATFERAGGDYYDAFNISPDGARTTEAGTRLGIFLADASGHGPSAAVVVAMVCTLLRTFPGMLLRPGAVLDHINHCLSTTQINHSFVTAFFGILDRETHSLTYACAGHPVPLIVNRLGEFETAKAAGDIPLGVRNDHRHTERRVHVLPGSTLVLYTDGVTEARNVTGEFFGEEGLRQALVASWPAAAEQVLRGLTLRLQSHQGASQPQDDQTLLVMNML
ncbi:MAG: serine/threonine-protein phosphatase [Candidatus Hydrogenedentes bacterium]|nr:serine/threonine-protein phosphatase [Candidatus Hydrogenedentota bacterium]